MLVKCTEIMGQYMIDGVDLISTNFVVGGIYEWKNGRIHGDTGKLLVGMAKGGVIRNWRLSYYVKFELFFPNNRRLQSVDLMQMDGQMVWTDCTSFGRPSCMRKVEVSTKKLWRLDELGNRLGFMKFSKVDGDTPEMPCYLQPIEE